MIFAEMDYPEHYWEIHTELVEFINLGFADVKSGIQSDSYIHIFNYSQWVKLDTFSSKKHQVKSEVHGKLVQQVIQYLQQRYSVTVYTTPILEDDDYDE